MATKAVSSSLVPVSLQALALLEEPAIDSDERASWVKGRLISIAKEVSERYYENGLRLQEIKNKQYWKDWAYDSFNECIDSLHDAGMLDYGARNARNFIAVVEMSQTVGLPLADILRLPISKLREICTIPDLAQQKQLLLRAHEMDVSEVQKEAKKLRAKAKGYDVDPLNPITLMMTDTMRGFFKDCIKRARAIYSVDDATSDVTVLVDMVLPEWFSSSADADPSQVEAEVIAVDDFGKDTA